MTHELLDKEESSRSADALISVIDDITHLLRNLDDKTSDRLRRCVEAYVSKMREDDILRVNLALVEIVKRELGECNDT